MKKNIVKDIVFKNYYGNISAVAILKNDESVKIEVSDIKNIVMKTLNEGNVINKLDGEKVPRIRVDDFYDNFKLKLSK